MADLVIPQGTSGQNFFGFFNRNYIFGQTFKAPVATLNTVTLTLDSANYDWWSGNGQAVRDVRYIVMVKDVANNTILYTSPEQVLAAIPGEGSNYGAVHEFRDVTVQLGGTGVTVGGSYAILVQVLDEMQYVETSSNSNDPYADGYFFYSWGGNPLDPGWEMYGWDMTMSLNGSFVPVNIAPVAVADSALAVEDGGAVTINVLANDTDADSGDTKTLVSVNTTGTVGSVTMNADGTVSYNPGANFQSLAPWMSATDTFSYTMKDKAGAESTTTVTVTVRGSNDAPTAVSDVFQTVENGDPVLVPVIFNDIEIDGGGDFLMVDSIDTTGTKGAVTINAMFTGYSTGTAFESLGAGEIAYDTFRYTARDVHGAKSTATVTMTIVGANDAPVAANDAVSVQEDQSVTINVLANDTDIDANDAKTIVSVTSSQQGASLAVVDGKIVYTADADAQDLLVQGETSVDTLTYVMADRAGVQSTATVTVTVQGVANGANINGTNKNDTALNGTAADETIDGGNGDDVVSGLAGADTLYGGNGNDKLFGGQGIDKLFGDNGGDVLNGGAGDDVLTGGNGVDVFVFDAGFGKDTITDFKSQNDTIQISSSLLGNFAAVLSHASQVGGDVVISVDANNSITLVGMTLDSLVAKDFIFA